MGDDVGSRLGFSIPVRNEPPGKAKQRLVKLLQSIRQAQLELKAISWFSYGRRGRLFCVPKDPDAFRAFATGNALRAREVTLIETRGPAAVSSLQKVALGAEIHAFSALPSGQGVSFVWFKDKGFRD